MLSAGSLERMLPKLGLERLSNKCSQRYCKYSEAIRATAEPRLPISLRSLGDGWFRFARHDGAAESICSDTALIGKAFSDDR